MPCGSRDASEDFSSNTMATGNMYKVDKKDDITLHNKVAKFVLDIQSDVALEDLLDSGDSTRSSEQPKPQKYQTMHLNEHQRQALVQLYNEIKYQQAGTINVHEWSAKRRQAENVMGLGNTKVPRNTECLLQDSDHIDENWLMSLAAQLGLDKNMDLPELNSDFVTEHT